jgi:hypothetical protein
MNETRVKTWKSGTSRQLTDPYWQAVSKVRWCRSPTCIGYFLWLKFYLKQFTNLLKHKQS